MEWAPAGIGLHINADKTEYMYFNQRGDISTINGSSLKLVDKFANQGSRVSSTEKYIDTRQERHGQLQLAIGHMDFRPDW